MIYKYKQMIHILNINYLNKNQFNILMKVMILIHQIRMSIFHSLMIYQLEKKSKVQRRNYSINSGNHKLVYNLIRFKIRIIFNNIKLI